MPNATTGTAMVLYEAPSEVLRDAIADVEIYIYESWDGFHGRLTLDAARRFLVIAEIFGWDMPWVAEMREWSQ